MKRWTRVNFDSFASGFCCNANMFCFCVEQAEKKKPKDRERRRSLIQTITGLFTSSKSKESAPAAVDSAASSPPSAPSSATSSPAKSSETGVVNGNGATSSVASSTKAVRDKFPLLKQMTPKRDKDKSPKVGRLRSNSVSIPTSLELNLHHPPFNRGLTLTLLIRLTQQYVRKGCFSWNFVSVLRPCFTSETVIGLSTLAQTRRSFFTRDFETVIGFRKKKTPVDLSMYSRKVSFRSSASRFPRRRLSPFVFLRRPDDARDVDESPRLGQRRQILVDEERNTEFRGHHYQSLKIK